MRMPVHGFVCVRVPACARRQPARCVFACVAVRHLDVLRVCVCHQCSLRPCSAICVVGVWPRPPHVLLCFCCMHAPIWWLCVCACAQRGVCTRVPRCGTESECWVCVFGASEGRLSLAARPWCQRSHIYPAWVQPATIVWVCAHARARTRQRRRLPVVCRVVCMSMSRARCSRQHRTIAAGHDSFGSVAEGMLLSCRGPPRRCAHHACAPVGGPCGACGIAWSGARCFALEGSEAHAPAGVCLLLLLLVFSAGLSAVHGVVQRAGACARSVGFWALP